MVTEIPEFMEMGPYAPPQSVAVVGCGGTGGYVIPPLARLICVHNSGETALGAKRRLILIDGDDVEQKNLERQHFIKSDLGRNKAEAMASRYSAALGMEIGVIPEYLESADVLTTHLMSGVVIGCVDNNASRRVIHEWFSADTDHRGRFWIDSGNEEAAGQVVCGYMPPKYEFGRRNEFSLPSVAEVYPSLLRGELKFNSQLSCAEMAESSPQNMMTNVTAAALVLNFVQKILRGEPLACHGVKFSIDNSFRTMLNTASALEAAGLRRRRWELRRRESQGKESSP